MSKFGRIINRIQCGTEDWFGIASALIIAFMMFFTTVDVIMRKVFHSPIAGSFEYVMLLFVGVVFLGLAVAQRTDEHLQLGILYERLKPRGRRVADIITVILCLGIFIVITVFSGKMLAYAFERGDTILGTIQILTWPSRLIITLGSGLLCFRFIRQLVLVIRTGTIREPADANKAAEIQRTA